MKLADDPLRPASRAAKTAMTPSPKPMGNGFAVLIAAARPIAGTLQSAGVVRWPDCVTARTLLALAFAWRG